MDWARPVPEGGRRHDVEGAGAPGPQSPYADLVAGPFRDVLPERALAKAQYTVRDQWMDLVKVPQRPRKLFNWRHVLALAKRTTDFFGHRRTWLGNFFSRVNPYPQPFRRVEVPSFDGTLISGWLGLQPVPRPGVVIVPGMFSSKDDTAHKGRAIRMWRRWDYNVLAIDLRGFGYSEHRPNTAGWKEAEDVLAAARYLHSFNTVTNVAVMGDSLGATACMLAAAQEGIWLEEAHARMEGRAVGLEERPTTGAEPWSLPGAAPVMEGAGVPPGPGPSVPRGPPGLGAASPPGRMPVRAIQAVLAWSPFSDAYEAVTYISRLPARRDPFYHVQRLFTRLLMMHTKGKHRDFLTFMEDSARGYNVPPEVLFARSDLHRVVRHIRVPTLVIHAENDSTVPVAHARRLADKVAGRDDITVWIVPWGRHVEFDLLDRRWYWRVVSRFMAQWVGR